MASITSSEKVDQFFLAAVIHVYPDDVIQDAYGDVVELLGDKACARQISRPTDA